MQQAISQNSGSLAESESAGDKHVMSSASAAMIARHVAGCLNAFAFITLLNGKCNGKMFVAAFETAD